MKTSVVQIKAKISPFLISCIIIWLAWVLITSTERIYYSDNPKQVIFLWIKIRSLQGFNGI